MGDAGEEPGFGFVGGFGGLFRGTQLGERGLSLALPASSREAAPPSVQREAM